MTIFVGPTVRDALVDTDEGVPGLDRMATSATGGDSAQKPRGPLCGSGDLHVREVINGFRAIAVESQQCGNTAVLAYPQRDPISMAGR